MNPFETETMADLCLRQGHAAEALAIYQRLMTRTTDHAVRARMARRIAVAGGDESGGATLAADVPANPRAEAAIAEVQPAGESPPAPADPMASPGVRARWSRDHLTIEWRLPPNLPGPILEVLLVTRGPDGVGTETREIALERSAGQLTLGARDLHLVRVAAGSRGPRGFVPLARG